jgi:hypothetical protein
MRRLYLLWVICIAVIFTSCSTSNKFASSFGKRRYTKGYYVDVPSSVKVHIASYKDLSPIPVHSKVATVDTKDEAVQVATVVGTVSVQENKKPVLKAHAFFSNPAIQQRSTLADAPPAIKGDDTKKTNGWKNSGETNYFAIVGFLICCVGIGLTIAALNFTTLSLIFLGVGVLICVYSFFRNKIYFDWLAIVGISLTIILFALLLL